MTDRSDFNDLEWQLLLEAPLYAGIAVMTSDMNITGLLREGRALVQSVDNRKLPQTATPFLKNLVSEIRQSFESAEQIPSEIDTVDPQSQQKNEIEALEEVNLLAKNKMDPDEAGEFKNWVVEIAIEVARAAREGGFWGMGGQQVSHDEQAAINQTKLALDLQD